MAGSVFLNFCEILVAIVLAMKFTFSFLNLAKIHIFNPKSTGGGGGSTSLGKLVWGASLNGMYDYAIT